MMCNTGFEFRIKDMFFEPLENISITLFILFHPLCYSIHLKTYWSGLITKKEDQYRKFKIDEKEGQQQ